MQSRVFKTSKINETPNLRSYSLQAIHDILNIQDARAFYEASGVRPKRLVKINDENLQHSRATFHFPQLRIKRNEPYLIDRQFGDEGSPAA